jgi:DNA-directed RNA polymerase subunit RPC12/RpoP
MNTPREGGVGMTTTTEPRQIEHPRLRGHRLHCPRCESRLMFDGDEHLCVACGYEFPDDQLARDVRRELGRHGRSRPVVVGLGAGLVLGGVLGRGLGLLGWLGATTAAGVAAAVAVAFVVTRASRLTAPAPRTRANGAPR